MTRSHIAAPLAVGARLTLPEDASVHLLRVLRLQVGDACVLFNGDGHDYAARITGAQKKAAEVEIEGATPVATEAPLRIVLAQALARGDKMDLILQKATELGVAAIVPLVTERTEVRLGGERADRRMAHWQAVIASACEQCGRSRLPELYEPTALADFAATRPAGLRLILDPQAGTGLGDLPAAPDRVTVVIGPEGGLSERDLATLAAADFRGLRFGPRILRTETAGLAVLAALLARFGDLG
nr:16S rRNA (uracil(1498)-N(3))-methyltransferase [Coralloluteibacterium stylophorae]